ncbi:MAG: ATP-binding cassette domain-containing protein [Ornithinimicrobium sp.]
MSATSPFTSATTRPMAHLRVDGVSKSFGDRRVLSDVSFAVATGEPAGLIGENGSGKSTLLRIAAGLTSPDAGVVTAKAPAIPAPRIGILHQVPPFTPQMTIAEALEASVAPSRRAAAAVADTAAALAENPDDPASAAAYRDALGEAERCDAWATDARIDTMLAGLGIADLPRHRVVTKISGGQRSRLSLAWVLLNAPDILLLDEPTNHLDDSAVDHLCRVITRWRGPVLTASHDRVFLTEAVTSLVDLDPFAVPRAWTLSHEQDDPGSGLGVTRFSGTYRDYVADRRRVRDRWERQYRDEQAEIARLAAAEVDNHSVGNSARAPRTEARSALKFYSDRNAKVVSRRVHRARAQLENLQEHQIAKPPRHLSFRG